MKSIWIRAHHKNVPFSPETLSCCVDCYFSLSHGYTVTDTNSSLAKCLALGLSIWPVGASRVKGGERKSDGTRAGKGNALLSFDMPDGTEGTNAHKQTNTCVIRVN